MQGCLKTYVSLLGEARKGSYIYTVNNNKNQ